MKKIFFLFGCLLLCMVHLCAQTLIATATESGAFPLVNRSGAATILVDRNDHWLIAKTAEWLAGDIQKVTGIAPKISNDVTTTLSRAVIIGTIGRSAMIDALVKSGKLDLRSIVNQWEAYHVQVVQRPFPGVSEALVIAGSDRRGAAFGAMELSRQIGVSPWYWWADVPVKTKKELYVRKGASITDRPKVKYRGIFINDEAPAFSGWAIEKFGGVNHLVYEKVFELLLRNKANYLWPAMWGKAFADDDTLNPILADRYGIVISNSHHEPMLRAQQEWKKYGTGAWNYQTNDSVLRAFWRKGIQNMGTRESVISIGMRGDGDMPMTQGSNIALLERIVADQRRIIEEVTGKPASATPQSWALYKEVQDYYDKGMRVPDDVTLLLCDDNWGNIRKLPRLSDAPRKGGYGVYYHFDYVGGPRNYKWLNTNPLPRVWEQMHLAYEYKVRDIWIVNVGDIKPMELPISFFLDYAWNPERIAANQVQAYTQRWAAEQFGEPHAAEIADILSRYAKYNGRRKPELLDANTYAPIAYNELNRVTDDYNLLNQRAQAIADVLPAAYQDAYFQLVLHPVKACANLQNFYTAVAYNRIFTKYSALQANRHAENAKKYFLMDSLISKAYNEIANGKWNHMMDQSHIGYTSWNDPPRNRMPQLGYVSPDSAKEPPTLITPSPATAMDWIPKETKGNVFYEVNGYFSIDADHYTRAVGRKDIQWQVLPDHGRTGSAVTTMPVTAAKQTDLPNAPYLEYEVYLYDTGALRLQCLFSPTLNFHNDEGLQYAVSVDNEAPQVISINKDDNNPRVWDEWMRNNIISKTTTHTISTQGKHTVRYRMVSPAVVLQKITGDMGGLLPSYLGPPESRYSTNH